MNMSTTQVFTNSFSPKVIAFSLSLSTFTITFLFDFFSFNTKPEGIEKEETFNTLLCASGKCQKIDKILLLSHLPKYIVVKCPLGHVSSGGKKGNKYTIPCANQRTFDGEQSFPHKDIEKLRDSPESSWLIMKTKADDHRTGFFPNTPVLPKLLPTQFSNY